MRDVAPDILRWLQAGQQVALSTVVQTWGSAPRRLGAHMAVNAQGEIAGSVSGGCVEGAVVEASMEAIKTGKPQLLHFGVADETAWGVGLACGGQIEVFVEPLNQQQFNLIARALTDELPVAVSRIVKGDESLIGKGALNVGNGRSKAEMNDLPSELTHRAFEAAQQALAGNSPQRVALAESIELFTNVYPPSPTLVVVGGVHIATALAELAKLLGFRTIIIDPRRAFATQTRFPGVDKLLQAWPEEAFEQISMTSSTAVATLTHDPKIDDPALIVALNSPAFYVGALGSQTTQAKRRKRLAQAGMSEEQLNKIRGPIGLEIGAQTPEEIALSIMAEIVAAQHSQAPNR